ncbi:MAG: hypothetical protein ACK4N5_19305, partial [Myxococcales bacterium]
RIVISYDPARAERVEQQAKDANVPFLALGTTGGDRLVLKGLLDVPVAALEQAYRSGLPDVLAARVEARPPDRETGVP